MIHKIIFVLLVTTCALMMSVAKAATNDQQELERLNQIEAELTLQRQWAEYRWKKTSAECYEKFFVNSCLSDARTKYRREIDPIRTQEVLLNENQRIIRERIKTERDLQRAAERADPKRAQERADNEKAFEQKQKDAAARAADLEERRKDAPRRAQENKSGVKLD
jgi:opacity protein-like surface antigen